MNVVYAPDPTLTASAAGGASGQIALAEQRRFYDQLQEQQRQFDAGMQFRAEMAALEAHLQSRAQAQQAYQFDAGQQLRYDQLGAQLQLEQQQLAAQQEAQQQVTERALAGELGAMARQREANKVRVGLAQLGAIDDALSNREITRAQADEAYGQLQEMLGFDVSALGAIAERQQQEQMQVDAERQQQIVASAFEGLPGNVPSADRFISYDRDGNQYFDNSLLQREVEDRRAYQRAIEIAEAQAQVKLQTEQQKAQTTQQKELATQVIKPAYEGFAEYQADEARFQAEMAAWERKEAAAQEPQTIEVNGITVPNPKYAPNLDPKPVQPQANWYPGIPVYQDLQDPSLDLLPVGTPFRLLNGQVYIKEG